MSRLKAPESRDQLDEKAPDVTDGSFHSDKFGRPRFVSLEILQRLGSRDFQAGTVLSQTARS